MYTSSNIIIFIIQQCETSLFFQKKLPGNSLVLIVPSRPNQGGFYVNSPRMRYWQHNLTQMCKVLNLATSPGYMDEGREFSTFEESLEYLMTCIRSKVIEVYVYELPNNIIILALSYWYYKLFIVYYKRDFEVTNLF